VNKKTKTGELIGCGSPNPTTLEQANENRKKLGLLPFNKAEFDKKISEILSRPIIESRFFTFRKGRNLN
jgi:hypothetical protein